MWRTIRDHPVITLVCLACTVGGAVAALWLAPDEWALFRKLGAGATTGAFMAFTVVAARTLGAFKVSESDDRS